MANSKNSNYASTEDAEGVAMYNEAASDGATNAGNPKIGEELVEGGSLAVVEGDGISTSGEAVPEGAPDSPPQDLHRGVPGRTGILG